MQLEKYKGFLSGKWDLIRNLLLLKYQRKSNKTHQIIGQGPLIRKLGLIPKLGKLSEGNNQTLIGKPPLHCICSNQYYL